MKQILFTLLLFTSLQTSQAQFDSHNMIFHSLFAITPTTGGATPSGFYNDCWGYSADGREYAIFGSLESVYFVDITNPALPLLVAQFLEIATPASGGTFSLWRDFKTFGHYAYAVVDLDTSPMDEEGLIIFDLSDLPNSVTKVNHTSEFFSEAHNIFIDEPNARLYACGSESSAERNGLIVLDLSVDPANPTLLSSVALEPLNYVHDLYVADNIAYCSHGETSTYGIWNFEDPVNPFLVASVETGSYQHSSWPTTDNNYAFYCEETQNTPIGVIDISDVDYSTSFGNDIDIINTFREPLLAPVDTGNIAHNPFIKDDLLYISYYEDGLQIFDVSDPEKNQPPRVAYFDTSPGTLEYTTTLNNWGTYPYYDSGVIIATDTELGLFVLEIEEIPLAVELHQFIAQPDYNKVRLEWASLSELNHAKYVVERSFDVQTDKWEVIEEVEARGNTPEGMFYTVWDDAPQKGINYYRLRMEGTDYKKAYSDIVSVEFVPQAVEMSVYPTLIHNDNRVHIQLEETTVPHLTIELLDMNGQLLQSQELQSADGQSFDVELGDLPKGAYILKVKGQYVAYSQQIVKG